MRLSLLALVWTVAACGSDKEEATVTYTPDVPTHAASDAASDAAPDTSEITCPMGHVLTEPDECQAVGIQGCDDMFIHPETGLCEPSTDHCPPGQIPVFSGDDQGCHPVGLPDCHPDFIDPNTGLCHHDSDVCEPGLLPIPTLGCLSLDPPGGCGEGTWGGVEELAGDVHVDVSYGGADSNGSRDKPWTMISYALGAAEPGGRVVLAAGVYDESVLLTQSISMVGRCASMVALSGTHTGYYGATTVEAEGDIDVQIADVKITGEGFGVLAYSGARMGLLRVRVEDSVMGGIGGVSNGTQITANDVLVTRASGFGVLAQEDAKITLERTAITHVRGQSLSAREGATVTATDLMVAHTQPPGDGTGGGAITVMLGASLSLERVAITDNINAGLFASHAGTTATATEVLIARTQPLPDGRFGRGINIQDGPSLTLDRVAITENHDIGLSAIGEGATVLATDVLVARTTPPPHWTFDNVGTGHGRGIYVDDGAQLTLERATIAENHEMGLWAGGADTTVVATDVLISRTQPWPNGMFGRGIDIQDGASLILERAAITDNCDVGLSAALTATTAVAKDVLVSRTQPMEVLVLDGWSHGVGISVQTRASLTLERAAVTDNHRSALFFYEAEGSVADSLLEGTKLPPAFSDGVADGLLVVASTVDATGVIARANARAGVLYDRSAGTFSSCRITGNAIGLVNQGLPGATVADENVVTGNEQDGHDADDLAVPNEPMELPKPVVLH